MLGVEPVRAETTRTAREKGPSRSAAEMLSWTAGDKNGPGYCVRVARRRTGATGEPVFIVSREVEDWRVERAVWSARPHAARYTRRLSVQSSKNHVHKCENAREEFALYLSTPCDSGRLTAGRTRAR